ncbi:MAG: xanthan lyase [Paludibacter sp.]|nr:xanthan lyase [Paludibacter sp.]
MNKNYQTYILIILLVLIPGQMLLAQKALEQRISDSLTVIANAYIFSDRINKIKIDVNRSQKTVTITAGENFGELPFRRENVDRINNALKSILEKTYPDYSIKAKVYNRDIEKLIPGYLTEKRDSTKLFITPGLLPPLVTKLSVPFHINKGLNNRNIALWNSHGRHYNNNEGKWTWQRPRLFLTVEDLLTTSFVLPYLAPMLENAGAQVFIPRERDIQIHEVVVDNDDKSQSRYKQSNRRYHWQKGETGFSNKKTFYLYPENPFKMGTHHFIKTTSETNEISAVEWIPNIPEKGMYAVYVSYQTLENSTEDAHYTVHHLGGKTAFSVNQTMFGGTWLYLGHFLFDEGLNQNGKVTLTNLSKDKNKILTADAVKFGGGIGNIAVIPRKNNGNCDTLPTISNFPRFAEGAKYWLQWAGIPDTIYSRTANTNEYSDDFQSRGFWVNYLAGGSAVNPDAAGLRIPVDMAFAFHTDAGIKKNDSIVGTLGICTVGNNNGSSIYKNGVSRWAARDMVDLIQTQIVDDLRKSWRSEWTRRGIWNRSYSESRVPEVPTMLLELLSHQNFEDMKYALDPRFRFMVSRAIYKGILKHFTYVYGSEYIVQPLPVEEFSCHFISENRIRLQWETVNDTLEPTAVPDNFVIYTRINDGGFDNGKLVAGNTFETNILPGKIYSFKITAVNQGGESFPSEILSAYRDPNKSEIVLIVNGFERISGPENFNLVTLAGFLTDQDAGVPYHYDVSFTGSQCEFGVEAPYINNENPGFGASASGYEHLVVAGNTFDYPFIHGKSIKSAGYSFVSTSVKSVISGAVNLQNYKVVDLILGKQKQTMSGNVKKLPEFQTFPLDLQQKLTEYCHNGGNLMVSGAYVASDLYDKNREDDGDFVSDLLKIKPLDKDTIIFSGVLYESRHPVFFKGRRQFEYHHTPNNSMYAVEDPDLLEPADDKAFVICQYEGNDYAAGVAYAGKYKTCTFGFPFETIKDGESRDRIMTAVLQFFLSKKQP